jgi:ABC-type multidrug transport system fused ATPase/permease subunit
MAIVGPSGAGKSTLAAVLCRLLSYEKGSISLGGIELSSLSGDDVRDNVGLVAQDAHLFNTTLAANLRIGQPSASDSELLAALARVGLCSWLEQLPRGLDTEVGTWGRQLSGGQRHRVAVARALMARFTILVLVETAEHLDIQAAEALLADLLSHAGERSTIVITHRLAGLEDADEVVVLDAGILVEQGPHDQLVQAQGRYALMWAEEIASSSGFDHGCLGGVGLDRSKVENTHIG